MDKLIEMLVSAAESVREEILRCNTEVEPLLKKIFSEKWATEDRDLRKARSLLDLMLEKLDYLILFFGESPANNMRVVSLLIARTQAVNGLRVVSMYVQKKQSFEKKLT